MKFGENLKRLRQEANLSQKQVADYLNVKIYTISDWERGRAEPSLDAFQKLCVLFDVASDEVLEIDNIEQREKLKIEMNIKK